MARDEGVEAELEGLRIEWAGEAHEGRHVVGGRAGLELVDEPEALLGEGEWEGPGARDGEDGRRLSGECLARSRKDSRGERGDGGGLEEGPQRQLDTEGRADAGNDLGGEERVATEGEEVVGDADALEAKDGGEDGGELVLGGVARSDEGGVATQGVDVRSREPVASELPGRSQGQRRQGDEGGGHHVLGEALEEEGAEGLCVKRSVGGEDDVADEALVARDVLTDDGCGVTQARRHAEDGLDFTQLDAEATHLHLEVEAAEELEGAVGLPASGVTGAVEPVARDAAERVGHEGGGGGVRPSQVAVGEVGATDEDFTGDADGDGLTEGVEDVELRVANGAADGRQARPGGGRTVETEGGDDVGLGGAVLVFEDAAGELLEEGGEGGVDLKL
ncbi:hypothetical protein M0222_25350, partial [Myxococcus fulvus]|nr:hypothetical protein [Myxococcus fulvus]